MKHTPVLVFLMLAVATISLRADWATPVALLLAQWDKYAVIALGEWHGSEQDAELRRQLIAHPEFAAKVRTVVIEFGNARHQPVLDRYMVGEDIGIAQLHPLWRDLTTPGGADPAICEDLLRRLRALNQSLPAPQRLRVLAADPPIDWSAIHTRAEWLAVASRRDAFAADLVVREVLSRGGKAIVIIGAGHLWQKNRMVREENFAARLKRSHPGKLLTVGRIGPPGPPVRRFVLLNEDPVGTQPANGLLGLPVPLFQPETPLREVLDAAIYTDSKDIPRAVVPETADPEFAAELARRIAITR